MKIDENYIPIVSLDQIREAMILYDTNPETLEVLDTYRVVKIKEDGIEFFDLSDSTSLFVRNSILHKFIIYGDYDGEVTKFFYYNPIAF